MKEVKDDRQSLSLRQVFGSVLASFFGVQKNATRERDFTRGRARDFILVGFVLTAGFVLIVWLIVQFVVASAG